MPTPVPTSPAPPYDWRAELGEVPLPDKFLPGQHRNTHPLTRALSGSPAMQARAHAVVERAVRLAEGRIALVAEMIGVHYLTALRLVHQASEVKGRSSIVDLAGKLRFQFGHAGPTGLGIQRAKRRPKPKPTLE